MCASHSPTTATKAGARTDVPTGLGDRCDLDERVRRARVGDTIIVCDLDHFKSVNDASATPGAI